MAGARSLLHFGFDRLPVSCIKINAQVSFTRQECKVWCSFRCISCVENNTRGDGRFFFGGDPGMSCLLFRKNDKSHHVLNYSIRQRLLASSMFRFTRSKMTGKSLTKAHLITLQCLAVRLNLKLVYKNDITIVSDPELATTMILAAVCPCKCQNRKGFWQQAPRAPGYVT